MQKNPAQPKSDRKINTSMFFETLTPDMLKATIANVDYTQIVTRTWRDTDTGTRKAS